MCAAAAVPSAWVGINPDLPSHITQLGQAVNAVRVAHCVALPAESLEEP